MTKSITADRPEEAKDAYAPSMGLHKKDRPSIHTMPKKFLHTSPQAVKQVKGMGFIILIIGGIILIAGLIFMYFYFKDTGTSTARISAPENNNQEKTTDSSSNLDTNNQKAVSPEPAPKKAAPTPVIIPDDDNIKNIPTSSKVKIATTSKKTVEVTPDERPATYTTAQDSDQDGLTDAEELLLNSGPNKQDSDNDGYDDLSELSNLYNPAGAGKIIVNANVKKYSNPTHNYALYYPSLWTVSQADGHDSIMFNLGNEQKVQVVVLSGMGEGSLDEWYKQTFTVTTIKNEQMMYKPGWSALRSEDGLTTYLKHPDSNNIISVTYNLALENVLHFKNIYEMMVNSLEIE